MKVELVKYTFTYQLEPAHNARMIGSRDDQEWSEYVYRGESPDIEMQRVEATQEDINYLFEKEVKLPNFDLEDYCGYGLGGIKDLLQLKLKNNYHTESLVEFVVYAVVKGDCIIEVLNKRDELYIESRLKEEKQSEKI